MAAELTFRSGDVQSVDYTPSADVAAGAVIVVGEIPMVAHVDIPEDTKGALAASGGVYRGATAGNLATPGALAYWDASAKKLTATTSGNKHFGYTVPNQGAAVDGTLIEVIHLPARAGT